MKKDKRTQAFMMSDPSQYRRWYLQTLASIPKNREKLASILFDRDTPRQNALDQSGLQAACSVFDVERARNLAELCINETGQLDHGVVTKAKELLEKQPFSLLEAEQRKRDAHLLNALSLLSDDKRARALIQQIRQPEANRLAEQAIRATLLLASNISVDDSATRKAVLTALFTTLRQSLGSCFATAPAIIVHEEYPLLFLHDLQELISSARLTRTVSGNQYSVPMSKSWGQGELKKPISLEATPNAVWTSPILLEIVETLGICKGESGALLEHLERLLGPIEKPIVTNVEELLKALLLAHVDLTPKELSSYVEPRTFPMGLAPTKINPKEHKCKEFFALFEQAKQLFVSSADCALLKCWEYSIASFTEVKFNLCQWNFYASLGVNWNDIGGIGQVLYEIAQQHVDEANLELSEHQEKYNSISLEIEYLSRRLQQASTEQEIRWIKVEYQSRQAEQYHIKELCDSISERANKIGHLHQFLIDQYQELMKDYFQEIYDADLHDIEAGPFDDSPAGFRLLYKHGRANPSLWTTITCLDEYIQALISFFTITEQELQHSPQVQGIETEFSNIITRLSNHLRSDTFIDSAFDRTAIAHGVRPIKDPQLHIESIEKKPWVYTSGGSMNILVNTYFGLEHPPEEAQRWVENETELLAFFIDETRKSMNQGGSNHRPAHLLAHSPTHAFSLLPLHPSFIGSWSSQTYSYSWIKAHLTDPAERFYSSCVLNPRAVETFCHLFSNSLPQRIQNRFISESRATFDFIRPYELAREIRRLFSLDAALRAYAPLLDSISLDSLLYESVPFTPIEDVFSTIHSLLFDIGITTYESQLRSLIPGISAPLRSTDLIYLLKGLIAHNSNTTYCSEDILSKLLSAMRKKGLLAPSPVIFADSNWIQEFFAFVYSPSSQQVELWSIDAYGLSGQPITHWKQWLDGSRKDRTWGLLSNPDQYRGLS